jgi:hypothetical protein
MKKAADAWSIYCFFSAVEKAAGSASALAKKQYQDNDKNDCADADIHRDVLFVVNGILGQTIVAANLFDSRTSADISVGASYKNMQCGNHLQGNAEQRKGASEHNQFIAASIRIGVLVYSAAVIY